MIIVYSLDFHKFTIEQPDDETVCRKDTFSVSGSMNDPSDICGDNEDQHSNLLYIFKNI